MSLPVYPLPDPAGSLADADARLEDVERSVGTFYGAALGALDRRTQAVQRAVGLVGRKAAQPADARLAALQQTVNGLAGAATTNLGVRLAQVESTVSGIQDRAAAAGMRCPPWAPIPGTGGQCLTQAQVLGQGGITGGGGKAGGIGVGGIGGTWTALLRSDGTCKPYWSLDPYPLDSCSLGQGPFGSAADAQAWADSHPAIVATMYATAQAQGMGACKAAPPPPPGNWYCVLNPDGTVYGYQAYTAGPPTGTPFSFAGPYASEQDAIDSCGSSGGNGGGGGGGNGGGGGGGGGNGGGGGLCDPTDPACCPVCKCPDCVCPTKPPPNISCSLTASTAPNGEFGALDWCENVQQLEDSLVALGGQVVQWITTGILPPIAQVAGVTGIVLSSVFTWVTGIDSSVSNVLQSALQCWQTAVQSITGCDQTKLVNLGVLQALLKFFHKLRFGTDALAWLTVDIDISVRTIERVLDALIKRACRTTLPPVDLIYRAYTADIIDPDYTDCLLGLHGISPAVWAPFRQALGIKLSAQEVIQWQRRNGGAEGDIDLDVRQHGWTDEDDRQAVIDLYDRLPQLGELTSWVRHGAFDSEAVAASALDSGWGDFWGRWGDTTIRAQGITQDVAFRSYLSAQAPISPADARSLLWRGLDGITGPMDAGQYAAILRSGGLSPEAAGVVAQLAYVAVSPGDARELVYRQVASPDVYAVALRSVGHSGSDSDDLAALLYRPLSAAQVIDLNRETGPTIADLTRAWQAAGYSPADAADLARNGAEDWHRQQARAGVAPTLTEAAEWVRVGITTAEQVYPLISAQGWTEEQLTGAVAVQVARYQFAIRQRGQQTARMRTLRAVLSAYSVGTADAGSALGALLSVGLDGPSASALLADADVQERQRLATVLIGELRGAYTRGEITAAQAGVALTAAGITQERADQYVSIWTVKLTNRRKMLSAAEILRMAREGLLPWAIASQRLQNLGYSSGDVGLLLQEQADKKAEADQRAAQAQERAREAAQRRAEAAERARQRAAAAAAKAAAASAQAAAKQDAAIAAQGQAQERRDYPESLLRALRKDGFMDDATIRVILKKEGLDDDAITARLATWPGPAPAGAPVR